MQKRRMPPDYLQRSAFRNSLPLLEIVINQPEPETLRTMPIRLGISMQPAHRIVRQLSDEGSLERTLGGDGYRAGRRLNHIDTRTLAPYHRAIPIRAILQRIVDKLKKTLDVLVLRKDDRVVTGPTVYGLITVCGTTPRSENFHRKN